MIEKLGKPGISLDGFKAFLDDMKVKVDEEQVVKSYMKMDVNQDGHLSVQEFSGGMLTIAFELIPHSILQSLGLTTALIVPAVVGGLIILGLLFAFILVAMAAFTSPGAAGTFIQSILAAGMTILTKSGAEGDDLDTLRPRVTEQIYEVLDLPKHMRPKKGKE
mmetsp:Transcript_53027/g.141017  ORF Transcript_53027/g.141017 Transcript_53027/m.141017 type:complete len:163 (-) Transcript_53027:223-711(-)